jgi:hypothetical protein
MRSRSRSNFLVDSVAGCAFLLSVFSGRSYDVHIAAGIVMTTAVVIHLGLHWGWVVDCSRKLFVGSLSGRRRMKVNYAVDIFIGAMFVISLTSGIGLMVSNTVFVSKIHGLSSWMFVLGAAVHIVLHWRWILTMLRGLRTKASGSSGVARPAATIQQGCNQRDVGRMIVSRMSDIPQSGKHEGEIV